MNRYSIYNKPRKLAAQDRDAQLLALEAFRDTVLVHLKIFSSK